MAQSRPLSIAAAGALALCVACAQAVSREVAPDDGATVGSGAMASRVAPVAAPAEPSGPALASAEGPARAGPLGALSQMVTTQALLVSLFLAPVSKDGSSMMARADASVSDGGTRPR